MMIHLLSQNNKMSKYQVQKQIDVKQLLQNKAVQSRFLNKIEKIVDCDYTYYISGADIPNTFRFNTKCLLVISIKDQEKAEIGYVTKVKQSQFPLRNGRPHMEIKSNLRYLKNFPLYEGDKLSINFHDSLENKNKKVLFKFSGKGQLLYEWAQLISDLMDNKEQTAADKLARQKSQMQLKFHQKEENNRRQIQLLRENIKTSNNRQIWNQEEIKRLTALLSQSNERRQQQQKHFKAKIEQQRLASSKKDAKITDLEKQLAQSRRQMKSHVQMQQKMKHTLQRLQQKLTQQSQKNLFLIRSMEQNIESLKDQLADKSSQINILQQQLSSLSLFPFFNGALNNNQEEKRFLKQSIEKLIGQSILSTQMLYKFDPANKTNFHHYIDNHQNITLIFKTSSGMHVAAYSQSSFCERKQATGNGAILSLTNRQMFPLIKDRRPIEYDNYYIIFGSSQINIRGGELNVLSNFGCSNHCYDTLGYQVSVLFGQKCKEVPLQWYEIHKVQFSR